jgi:hypothetical protein
MLKAGIRDFSVGSKLRPRASIFQGLNSLGSYRQSKCSGRMRTIFPSFTSTTEALESMLWAQKPSPLRQDFSVPFAFSRLSLRFFFSIAFPLLAFRCLRFHDTLSEAR